MNNSNSSNNNNNHNNNLFYKIWRDNVLKRDVLRSIHTINITRVGYGTRKISNIKKYNEIHSLLWILDHGYIGLLFDKVLLNTSPLVFCREGLSKLFDIVNDSNEKINMFLNNNSSSSSGFKSISKFFSMFINNYKESLYNYSDILLDLIIKSNNFIAFSIIVTDMMNLNSDNRNNNCLHQLYISRKNICDAFYYGAFKILDYIRLHQSSCFKDWNYSTLFIISIGKRLNSGYIQLSNEMFRYLLFQSDPCNGADGGDSIQQLQFNCKSLNGIEKYFTISQLSQLDSNILVELDKCDFYKSLSSLDIQQFINEMDIFTTTPVILLNSLLIHYFKEKSNIHNNSNSCNSILNSIKNYWYNNKKIESVNSNNNDSNNSNNNDKNLIISILLNWKNEPKFYYYLILQQIKKIIVNQFHQNQLKQQYYSFLWKPCSQPNYYHINTIKVSILLYIEFKEQLDKDFIYNSVIDLTNNDNNNNNNNEIEQITILLNIFQLSLKYADIELFQLYIKIQDKIKLSLLLTRMTDKDIEMFSKSTASSLQIEFIKYFLKNSSSNIIELFLPIIINQLIIDNNIETVKKTFSYLLDHVETITINLNLFLNKQLLNSLTNNRDLEMIQLIHHQFGLFKNKNIDLLKKWPNQVLTMAIKNYNMVLVEYIVNNQLHLTTNTMALEEAANIRSFALIKFLMSFGFIVTSKVLLNCYIQGDVKSLLYLIKNTTVDCHELSSFISQDNLIQLLKNDFPLDFSSGRFGDLVFIYSDTLSIDQIDRGTVEVLYNELISNNTSYRNHTRALNIILELIQSNRVEYQTMILDLMAPSFFKNFLNIFLLNKMIAHALTSGNTHVMQAFLSHPIGANANVFSVVFENQDVYQKFFETNQIHMIKTFIDQLPSVFKIASFPTHSRYEHLVEYLVMNGHIGTLNFLINHFNLNLKHQNDNLLVSSIKSGRFHMINYILTLISFKDSKILKTLDIFKKYKESYSSDGSNNSFFYSFSDIDCLPEIFSLVSFRNNCNNSSHSNASNSNSSNIRIGDIQDDYYFNDHLEFTNKSPLSPKQNFNCFTNSSRNNKNSSGDAIYNQSEIYSKKDEIEYFLKNIPLSFV
ncbi:hypothetical protein CYY_008517 [Polysphondylium violaceum]|uniref:Ankyrin repeat-containing protein n=1 Tax=Polysphondylium violaceum TaxID=133409 RepID=A0A8J4PN87_9MYCE|nr:hypothetical protein CYY_008517 [Polysphondylium violaceum]